QPGPRERRARRPLPRGPLLSPARRRARHPAARRAARGHPPPDRPLPERGRRALRPRPETAHRRGAARLRRARVAGQRARAALRRRAGAAARAGGGDHRGRPLRTARGGRARRRPAAGGPPGGQTPHGGERVTQYAKLREAAAGIIYLRSKLAKEHERESAELACVRRQLEIAVERDDDAVALHLIGRRDTLGAEVTRLTAELTELTKEAE